MNPLKRLGLAALFVVLGALFAASHALADGHGSLKQHWYILAPPEIDPPEPLASGKRVMGSELD